VTSTDRSAATTASSPALPASLRAAVAVAGIATLGNLLLAVAHTGATVPLLSAIGPEGGAVPPAVVAFTVGTIVYGLITLGLSRANRVAWTAGLIVSGLSILSGIGQFRGVVTALAMATAAALIVLLLLPASRQAMTRDAAGRR
jgi:lysylphosphatidylglycerol synthetase-like protein (DUF2156 family)